MAVMEDVLELYAEPYNPQRLLVCFDETSTTLGRYQGTIACVARTLQA